MRNTLRSACRTINSNAHEQKKTKPWKTKILSQGHKTLMYEIKVHVGPEAQIHRDQKKNKPREAKTKSQGHKTLMYGTWMHVGPKVKIHNKDQKKPNHEKLKIHSQGHETHVWKKIGKNT